MRAALWLLGLFGVAVAVAMFAGNNPGTVTVFWPPYRVDLSLNLVILGLTVLFVVLHLALRALAALFAMPGHARSWRLQHQERALHVALLESLSHLLAGRFIRARKSAESVLVKEAAVSHGNGSLTYSGRLRALSHLLAAESAHTLQDHNARDEHFAKAVEQASRPDAQGVSEALQLRAARWALEDHDALRALQWLDDMPVGASRRTIALRLRLDSARMARHTGPALETARLLSKHRAFSPLASERILRSLALELVATSHDPEQLMRVWSQLDASERAIPEVALAAGRRLLALDGDVGITRNWLLPLWERMVAQLDDLTFAQRINLIQVLEQGFSLNAGAPEVSWLTRIEAAQAAHPGDALLQYLAGVACMRLQLWGKAQQLLMQSLPRLQGSRLEANAWQALALLAEQRGDAAATARAWKKAATAMNT
jgi:HemY protein